ncbi:DUF6928 family protein [Rhodococcus sp. SGAir0479]|uniref:DUF6928 family protein n=1 Tax=Rhodococcus sp. SGAir0479 TaxID=2567884 RepID=UPI0010CD49E9|nr:hypothetical protein [Rhodococcus sp. SGAir0479]QCQ89907.1 hypothetical protein E7742_00915 [Rhodococcus sp. SGAir0479]
MPGLHASTLWYVDTTDPAAAVRGADPDVDAARRLALLLHPGLEATHLGNETLAEATKVADGEIVVGCFPGVAVVRTAEQLPPVPSSLVEHWIHPTGCRHTYLCSSSPVTRAGSWGAFAHWNGDKLERSFSATPVHIIENVGLPQVWERPFWAGEHPARPSLDVLPDPQTLPFDPGEFADAAPRAWLGDDLDPTSILLCRFAVHPAGQVPEAVLRREEQLREQARREEERRQEQLRDERFAQLRRLEDERAAAAGRAASEAAPERPRRRSLFARWFGRGD